MLSVRSFIDSWNHFFFSPRPTEGMAVFRIIWCSILLAYFLLDLNNISDFYGPHAILSLKTIKGYFPALHANIFQFFGSSYEVVYGVLAIYGVALVMSILGLYTRASLIVVLIIMTSLHQRNIWLLSSSEVLMRVMTVLLVCSPCGHSLSIDSLLGRKFSEFRRDKEWAPWAWRLIQIQLSVVYVWTVWHKLKGDLWFDGTAVYYATRLENLKNFTLPYFLDALWFLKISTWGTLALELALGTLIWFKEFRRPLILGGILFHLGIEYMMSIPFFEIIMMALLLNFYTPEEYKDAVGSSRNKLISMLQSSKIRTAWKEKLLWAMQGNQAT